MVLACFPKPKNGAPNPAALNSHSFTTFFSFPFPFSLFLSFPSSLPLIPPKSPWNRASSIPIAQHEKQKVKGLLWFLQVYTIKNSYYSLFHSTNIQWSLTMCKILNMTLKKVFLMFVFTKEKYRKEIRWINKIYIICKLVIIKNNKGRIISRVDEGCWNFK